MISGRMFEIIRYLNETRDSSYKDICNALELKERNVRYDIDSINDELSIKGLSKIEKHSKGKLMVPSDLDLNVLIEDNEFLFLSEEREDIIRLIILFNITELNIRKLSEFFQVTRRSVQKDVDTVMKELSIYSMHLVYDRSFALIEDHTTGYTLRVNELKKYVYLINKKEEQYSTFELHIMKLMQDIFGNINIKDLYDWVNNRIETMNWTFSDNSFDWYVSNIITTCWCILNEYQLPPCQNDIDVENNSVDEIGTIIHRKLTVEQKQLISGFSSFTNKYVDLDINLDLIMTEDIISQLVAMMSEELEVYFMRDMILIKGLLNHVAPMLERVKGNIHVYGMDTTVIPESYLYIFETLKNVF
ncbi:MAG: PRD domain-containing protein [Coprobacillaceae bacterium]